MGSMLLLWPKVTKISYCFSCYFCDQNYFVIFAMFGKILSPSAQGPLVQASLILLSLVAKSNQKSSARFFVNAGEISDEFSDMINF